MAKAWNEKALEEIRRRMDERQERIPARFKDEPWLYHEQLDNERMRPKQRTLFGDHYENA